MSEINRYGISGGAAVQVSTGYFNEGQPPSSLNDGSRTVMADVRRYVEQTTPETTATYSAGAYTLALTRDLSAGELTQGFTAAFIAGSTNSASATLNINSTGAKNLLDGAGTHIVGEAIQNHQPVNVVYDKKKDGYRVTDQLKTIAELSPAKLSGVDELTASAVHTTNLSVTSIDKVTSINEGQIGGNRNYIYNGDTSLCQRATSVANIGNGDTGYHVQDRWQVQESGSVQSEFTMSRATEVPSGFQYSMKLDCTTAESAVAADEVWWLEQRLEGQDLYAWKKGTSDAVSVALSFWVNATKTGTNIVSLYDNDNTRHISKSYTVNSSDTWEHKTITFAGDTTGIFGRDANASLQVLFFLMAGSNYTSGTLATSWASYTAANAAVGQVNNFDSTSNNFHITGIQLELGETASAFQNETYGENFIRCARYFEKRVGGILYSANNAGGGSYIDYSHWEFKVRKRAVPTCTGHTGTQQQINEDSCGVYAAGGYASWSVSSTADAEL
jgi:hypothetical protein